MKKRILAAICVAVLLITGNSNCITAKASGKPVSLSKKKMTLKVGETKKLNLKKTAKVKIKQKTFTSSDVKVASVKKKTGKLVAKKAGKATITVKVKFIKKSNKKIKTSTLKCKVAVTGGNNTAVTRRDEESASRKPLSGNNVTETSESTDTSNTTREPVATMPIESTEPDHTAQPTEKPSQEEGKVIETATFDDFAQAAAQLVKDHKSSNGSSIAASDEFYSKRLIVKGKDDSLSFETYNPTAVIKNSDNIFMVQFGTSSDAKKAMLELANLPNVEYVEADSYSGSSLDAENDIDEPKSWGVSKIGADQYAKTVASDIKREIEVAVVDTGVSSHPFLNGRISDKGLDFVDVDETPYDLNSHGTHVAGTIVDCTPDLNVKIIPVRVLDEEGAGYSSIVGMGIRYAVNCGAKVINLSLGGGHSQYIDDNIDYAIKKGVTIVAAAGNEYGNTSNYCPSHLTNAIVVGAVDRNDNRAGFSNVGSSLDVVAPGVDIVSCVPGGGYKSYDGTSMATPHVSAIAAMLMLVYPEKAPADIEEMIKGCARDLGENGWDKQYGHGIPDMGSLQSSPSKSIFTLGKRKLALGMSTTELYHVLGTSSNQEIRTGMSPQGFETVAYNTENYNEYLLIYLKNDQIVGICGIGKNMDFNDAEAGKNGNLLNSNWKDTADYKTTSGKIGAKKLEVSDDEYAYAYYDALGDNDIYCIQVFDPTQLKNAEKDMIYMTKNLSYGSVVCRSIATEIGHMLNAFRSYRSISCYNLNDSLAQCAQDYCNAANTSILSARDVDYLLECLLDYHVDPLQFGEACYYGAADAVSFTNSLIEVDDFYKLLVNAQINKFGVGMSSNDTNTYVTVDYADEIN